GKRFCWAGSRIAIPEIPSSRGSDHCRLEPPLIAAISRKFQGPNLRVSGFVAGLLRRASRGSAFPVRSPCRHLEKGRRIESTGWKHPGEASLSWLRRALFEYWLRKSVRPARCPGRQTPSVRPDTEKPDRNRSKQVRHMRKRPRMVSGIPSGRWNEQ